MVFYRVTVKDGMPLASTDLRFHFLRHCYSLKTAAPTLKKINSGLRGGGLGIREVRSMGTPLCQKRSYFALHIFRFIQDKICTYRGELRIERCISRHWRHIWNFLWVLLIQNTRREHSLVSVLLNSIWVSGAFILLTPSWLWRIQNQSRKYFRAQKGLTDEKTRSTSKPGHVTLFLLT
jgi:hypothetical protein